MGKDTWQGELAEGANQQSLRLVFVGCKFTWLSLRRAARPECANSVWHARGRVAGTLDLAETAPARWPTQEREVPGTRGAESGKPWSSRRRPRACRTREGTSPSPRTQSGSPQGTSP